MFSVDPVSSTIPYHPPEFQRQNYRQISPLKRNQILAEIEEISQCKRLKTENESKISRTSGPVFNTRNNLAMASTKINGSPPTSPYVANQWMMDRDMLEHIYESIIESIYEMNQEIIPLNAFQCSPEIIIDYLKKIPESDRCYIINWVVYKKNCGESDFCIKVLEGLKTTLQDYDTKHTCMFKLPLYRLLRTQYLIREGKAKMLQEFVERCNHSKESNIAPPQTACPLHPLMLHYIQQNSFLLKKS